MLHVWRIRLWRSGLFRMQGGGPVRPKRGTTRTRVFPRLVWSHAPDLLRSAFRLLSRQCSYHQPVSGVPWLLLSEAVQLAAVLRVPLARGTARSATILHHFAGAGSRGAASDDPAARKGHSRLLTTWSAAKTNRHGPGKADCRKRRVQPAVTVLVWAPMTRQAATGSLTNVAL